jgi:hypothetical protein
VTTGCAAKVAKRTSKCITRSETDMHRT